MVIGSADVPETKRLKKRQMRKEKNNICSAKQGSSASSSNYNLVEDEGETEIEDLMGRDGARHLWHFVRSSRYLPKKHRDIIEPVISRNAYFAAPENMVLAM
ncbi:hypothetical protein AVEN_23445-1 [Araneus ventricosus]|uniref:Uncharacterized protein n=1 Tax=Araneus ventricosus TaxID=182803 RepID=A0A4Y2E7M9_ARAVE|nr:hypothetical protein AVEN_23445-1 [Araneus ventricosus]